MEFNAPSVEFIISIMLNLHFLLLRFGAEYIPDLDFNAVFVYEVRLQQNITTPNNDGIRYYDNSVHNHVIVTFSHTLLSVPSPAIHGVIQGVVMFMQYIRIYLLYI